MKIIVISDTHGKIHRIDEVIERNRDYDALLFLGDGLRDFAGEKHLGLMAVRGNCDSELFGRDTPNERMLTLDGVKLLMLHGHTHGVKSGIERAVLYAYERGADILLYGHTHEADERYFPAGSELCGKIIERHMYAFNSGSLGQPRSGKPSFGILQIKNGQILFSHGNI